MYAKLRIDVYKRQVLPVLQRNPIAIVDTVVIRHTPVTETHRGEFYTERLVAMRKIHLVHHRKPDVYKRQV